MAHTMANPRFAITQSLPEYQQLRKAFAQRKLPLAIVCGAGLSTPAKLPSWSSLRQKLQKAAASKVASFNQLGQTLYDAKLRTASSTTDFWVSFELLQDILSSVTFRNIVVEALTPDPTAALPSGYVSLMKLEPRGLITLNLDKFAGEALASVRGSKITTPVYGLEIATKWHVLRDAPQYAVYLHGEVTDPNNWVLTKSQLDKLMTSIGHTQFLTSLYMDHIVVFAGVSVDDIALSAKLLQIRQEGFKPPALFWLTTRLDPSLIRWANENYISLIIYQAASDKEHSDFIDFLADDLLNYIPVEDSFLPPAATARPNYTAVNAPLAAKDLAQLAPEEIRQALSQRLQHLILSSSSDELYQDFQAFFRTNRYPISRAFYKDDDPDFDTWFGFKLQFPSLGKGNFGEVFLSKGESGVMLH